MYHKSCSLFQVELMDLFLAVLVYSINLLVVVDQELCSSGALYPSLFALNNARVNWLIHLIKHHLHEIYLLEVHQIPEVVE